MHHQWRGGIKGVNVRSKNQSLHDWEKTYRLMNSLSVGNEISTNEGNKVGELQKIQSLLEQLDQCNSPTVRNDIIAKEKEDKVWEWDKIQHQILVENNMQFNATYTLQEMRSAPMKGNMARPYIEENSASNLSWDTMSCMHVG